MNPITTLEVHSPGRRPCVLDYDRALLRFGTRRGLDLVLDPGTSRGAEFRLLTGPDQEGARLEPVQGVGRYELNGVTRTEAAVVGVGDTLGIGDHRVTFLRLPSGVPRDSDASALTQAPESPEGPAPSAGPVDRGADPVTEAPLPGGPSESSPVAASARLAAARGGGACEPDGASPGHEARAPQPESEPGSALPGSASAVSGSQVGGSHLYLFFEPVRRFLADEEVSEILINGCQQVYVERKGRLEPAAVRFASEQALQAAVMNVARSIGRLFDRDHPRLDARLPDGSRLHAVLTPLSRTGSIVAIRKFGREKLTVAKLLANGSVSPEVARLLAVVVELGRNLLVSGATSSGKTSVLNVLSGMIPAGQRVLVLEDATELQLQQPHVVAFETRKPDEYGKGEVPLRDLLHSSLRLRPDRIVIGEIRGGEAMDLLQAMNTGHDGTMSTIHANNPVDALVRLESCAMLGTDGFPLSALRAQVASAVHIVVQTARLHDGSRKVTHVAEVQPLRRGTYACQDIVRFVEEPGRFGEPVVGTHRFTGYVPSFVDTARRRGLDVDGMFGAGSGKPD